MANIVYVDDFTQASNLIFHQPTQDVCNFVNQRVHEYANAVRHVNPDFAQNVLDKYNPFNDSNTMRYLESLKNRLDSVWQPDSIRFLPDVAAIQQAPATMLQWIMAHPGLRQQHINVGLSAFGGEYQDSQPGVVGMAHRDYRRATNGLIVADSNGELSHTVYHEYGPKEDLLTLTQQCSIMGTWKVIDDLLKSDDPTDPTSPWNELR